MACRRVEEQDSLMGQAVDNFVLQKGSSPIRFSRHSRSGAAAWQPNCICPELLEPQDHEETLIDVAELVDRLVARTAKSSRSSVNQRAIRPRTALASKSASRPGHLELNMRTHRTDAQYLASQAEPVLRSQQYLDCERLLRVPFESTTSPLRGKSAHRQEVSESGTARSSTQHMRASPVMTHTSQQLAMPFEGQVAYNVFIQSKKGQSATQPAHISPKKASASAKQAPVSQQNPGRSRSTGTLPNRLEEAPVAPPRDFSRWRPRRLIKQDDFEAAPVAKRGSVLRPSFQRQSSSIADPAGPWHGTFKRLQVEGQLDRDQLARALELGGIEAPVQDFVDRVLEKRESGYSTLDFIEFCNFVEGYKELQLQNAFEMFQQFDQDGSGTIDSSELSCLLKNTGIVPMQHVVAEILEEVDEDGNGNLDFDEFQNIVKHLRTREGFTKSEYCRIKRTFHEHDLERSGTLTGTGLFNVIRSMGYSLKQKDVASIAAKVDLEGEGRLNERMVLKCMRMAREVEMQYMARALPEVTNKLAKRVSAAWGADANMQLDLKGLMDVLHVLGLVPSEEVVNEVAEDIGMPLPNYFGLSEIWKFLESYREQEGLSRADMENIELTFSKFDRRRRHSIDARDVTAALAELGHTVQGWSHDLVMTFVAQVNHGDAKVTYFQFKQVVRKFRDWEIRRAFRLFDTMVPESGGIMALDLARKVLNGFAASTEGFEEDPADAPQPSLWAVTNKHAGGKAIRMNPTANYPSRGFKRLAFVIAALKRSADCQRLVRKYHGFNLLEVARLRDKFKDFDRHGNGRVGNYYLPKLCMEMFPGLATSEQMRPEILQACKESENELEPGLELDFDGFLRLMFRHHQELVEARACKEQLVVSGLDLKVSEVNEFREIFVDEDELLTGYLTFEQISSMLSQRCGCVLGGKRMAELRKVFKDIVSEKSVYPFSREADFPDFLKLMVKLLAIDFASIAGRSDTQQLTRADGKDLSYLLTRAGGSLPA